MIFYITGCKNSHATNLGMSFALLISVLITMKDMEIL